MGGGGGAEPEPEHLHLRSRAHTQVQAGWCAVSLALRQLYFFVCFHPPIPVCCVFQVKCLAVAVAVAVVRRVAHYTYGTVESADAARLQAAGICAETIIMRQIVGKAAGLFGGQVLSDSARTVPVQVAVAVTPDAPINQSTVQNAVASV